MKTIKTFLTALAVSTAYVAVYCYAGGLTPKYWLTMWIVGVFWSLMYAVVANI